jgi:predicted ABC-type sugar transport system permease subunit
LAGHGIYLALVILVFISVLLSRFFTVSNLLNVLRHAVFWNCEHWPDLCDLGGGIDLSVGATMGTVAIAISEITRGSNDNVLRNPGLPGNWPAHRSGKWLADYQA